MSQTKKQKKSLGKSKVLPQVNDESIEEMWGGNHNQEINPKKPTLQNKNKAKNQQKQNESIQRNNKKSKKQSKQVIQEESDNEQDVEEIEDQENIVGNNEAEDADFQDDEADSELENLMDGLEGEDIGNFQGEEDGEEEGDGENDNEEDEYEEEDENMEELDEEAKQKLKEKNIQKALEFRENQKKKGVIYLSKIPPYMKVSQLRKLFSSFGVERIYLTPEDESKRKFRIKTGGNKRRNYTEGWMEFNDKKMAKYVALVYNGHKIGGKRRSFYTEDTLNLKYLPKFKWENLTEKINYDMKMRKEKLKAELSLAKKQHDFYLDQVEKGKKIMGIKKVKDAKRAAVEDIDEAIHDSVIDEDEEPQMKLSVEDQKDRIRRVFKQKKPKTV